MRIDKPHRAILFDLVGVLLFPRPDYVPDGRVDAIDKLIGSVTNDDVFRRTTQTIYHLSEPEFDTILRQVAEKYTPFSEVWTLLPHLHRSYQLAIINNGTFLTYPLFQTRLKLDTYFDLFVSSAREGVRKPHHEIYRRTYTYLGVQPQHCLFMDDSLENIAGASWLHMQTIHWENRWQGFHEFERWLTAHADENYPGDVVCNMQKQDYKGATHEPRVRGLHEGQFG